MWYLEVSRWAPRLQAMKRLLAEDELAAVGRLRFRGDVERGVLSRGVLRLLLGHLLNQLPENIAFTYNANGKPAVCGVEFNVAHSEETILFATHTMPIGIDVQRVAPCGRLEVIGRACLAPRELTLLTDSSAPCETFLRFWTRKEAWLKAAGVGLTLPLTSIDISDPAVPLIAGDVAGVCNRAFRLVDLPVANGYFAACAISGLPGPIRLWQLRPGATFQAGVLDNTQAGDAPRASAAVGTQSHGSMISLIR